MPKRPPKSPAYQWYVKEWLSSPTRKMLSKAARSAYRDLLDYCWDGQGKLPSDPETLRNLADCTVKEWQQFGAQILRNFVPHSEGFITNARMWKQWKERKAFIRSRIRASKLGVAARSHGNHVVTSASASPSASAKHKIPRYARPIPAVSIGTAPYAPMICKSCGENFGDSQAKRDAHDCRKAAIH